MHIIHMPSNSQIKKFLIFKQTVASLKMAIYLSPLKATPLMAINLLNKPSNKELISFLPTRLFLKHPTQKAFYIKKFFLSKILMLIYLPLLIAFYIILFRIYTSLGSLT